MKSQAGSPLLDRMERVRIPPGDPASETPLVRANEVAPRPGPHSSTLPSVRILRLIEYVIKPGKSVDLTLRNSLVGRIEFDWGTLTGTIVDTLDLQQEDRLRMARMQPGVWIGNQIAMELHQQQRDQRPPLLASLMGHAGSQSAAPLRKEPMEPPDTGPAFTERDAALAKAITEIGGEKLAYTLALALQTIAEELKANIEPEKFLTSDEALSLANALMAQIPNDWNPQPPIGEAAKERI